MSEFSKRKLESHSVPVYNKRAYYGDVRPGQEYQEPKLYQQPQLSYEREAQHKVSSDSPSRARAASYAYTQCMLVWLIFVYHVLLQSTDFTKWTEEEIKVCSRNHCMLCCSCS